VDRFNVVLGELSRGEVFQVERDNQKKVSGFRYLADALRFREFISGLCREPTGAPEDDAGMDRLSGRINKAGRKQSRLIDLITNRYARNPNRIFEPR
jgi:hypothetical protein